MSNQNVKIGDKIVRTSDKAVGKVTYVNTLNGAISAAMENDPGHIVYIAAGEYDPLPNTAPAPVVTKDTFYRNCTKALIKVAKARKSLTVDDLLKGFEGDLIKGKQAGLPAFMTESAKAGLIKSTGRYRTSKRTGGPLKVWQSLIYTSKQA